MSYSSFSDFLRKNHPCRLGDTIGGKKIVETFYRNMESFVRFEDGTEAVIVTQKLTKAELEHSRVIEFVRTNTEEEE